MVTTVSIFLCLHFSAGVLTLNPSLEESFSLVTVEVPSCGSPCIVLDTSAVGELISDENGVVLHKHKPIDYINAIKVIEDRAYSREKRHLNMTISICLTDT